MVIFSVDPEDSSPYLYYTYLNNFARCANYNNNNHYRIAITCAYLRRNLEQINNNNNNGHGEKNNNIMWNVCARKDTYRRWRWRTSATKATPTRTVFEMVVTWLFRRTDGVKCGHFFRGVDFFASLCARTVRRFSRIHSNKPDRLLYRYPCTTRPCPYYY